MAETSKAGATLDSLIASFNARIAELQELSIGRNMSPNSCMSDLSEVDATLTGMEMQLQAIKDRVHEEALAIPKAKKLIEESLRQQKKLQHMASHVPSNPIEKMKTLSLETEQRSYAEVSRDLRLEPTREEEVAKPKEKKGRSSPPMWFITADEFDSLTSYMRGRLTLEKINAAVKDMAAYAEANSQLITAPNHKVGENLWERAMEVRDIARAEGVKGKHFFLESDIKGPSLKLDHTGKAILTILRHLGRISETRIGHRRVIVLLKPQ